MLTILRMTGRSCQVAYVFGRHICIPFLLPDPHHRRRPASLRRALEYLGGNWVKVGQALALRFDLLPSEYCRDLLAINTDLKSLPYPFIRSIIANELGRDPEQLFATFDQEPFAITSTGQFHKAMSTDNRLLAVKVQDPSLQRQFAIDVRLMRAVAAVLDWFSSFGAGSARTFVEDFARNVRLEMDFTTTARNAGRMAAFAEGDPHEANALVIPAYTSRRVLTSQFIDGVTVLEILRAIRQSDSSHIERLAGRGLDVRTIARHIYRNALNQIFRDGLLHTDLSPAGVLVAPNHVVCYVDFAVVARVSEELQVSMGEYLRCVLAEKLEEATDELMRWLIPSPSTDLIRFRRDIVRVLEDHVDGFRSPGQSRPREVAHSTTVRIMSVVRQHRVTISNQLLTCFIAILTTESTVLNLFPNLNILAEQRIFFDQAAKMDIAESVKPDRARASAINAYSRLADIFADLQRVPQSGLSIEISLRKLRIRLFQYGLLAVFVSAATYISFHDEALHKLEATVGIGPYWVPTALSLSTITLITLMWRQGRRLVAMDRSTVTEGEVSFRSFGRVR